VLKKEGAGMQARVKVQNEISVVYLSGRVDVETAEPFRAACLRELKGKRIIFDFSGLLFVGSQGLLPFLETLQSFHDLSPGSFKFTGVGVEFRKLFSATPLSVVPIHDTIDQAITAFYTPVAPVAPQVITPAPLMPAEFIAYRTEPAFETQTSDPVGSDEELDA
jgi:anti-anti-sigma factor